MIVVADSGPLHYLILLDHAELLRRFYGRVAVPDAVAAELISVGAPDAVRAWISHPPSWVEVLPVAPEAVAAVSDDLDTGERSAIALAEILHADLLLNRRGRRSRRGQAPAPSRDRDTRRAPSRSRAGAGQCAGLD